MTPYYVAVGVLFAGYGLFEQHRGGSNILAGWSLIMGGLALLVTAISAMGNF